jgi:hypothetical protein
MPAFSLIYINASIYLCIKRLQAGLAARQQPTIRGELYKQSISHAQSKGEVEGGNNYFGIRSLSRQN